MVEEISHHELKERIALILRSYSNIYSPTGVEGVLHDILIGTPDGGDAGADYDNYAFVTNAPGFETIKRKGNIVDGTPVAEEQITSNNAHAILEHDVRYNIVFIVDEKNSQDAENRLDVLQQRIMETLERHTRLEAPDTAHLDPRVDVCWPERVDAYKPEIYKGKSKQGRVITLHCIISTS